MYLNIHINLGEIYCKIVHWVHLTQNRTKWGGEAITKVMNYLTNLTQYFNDSKKSLYHRVSSAAWSVQHKNTWGHTACIESQGFQVLLQTEKWKKPLQKLELGCKIITKLLTWIGLNCLTVQSEFGFSLSG